MGTDPTALSELKALGLSIVPVTQIGGNVIIGFNRLALGAALDLDVSFGAQQDAEWMVEKFETVLLGAILATRQIGDRFLDWKTPDRDRTLRQFTFHIFDRLNATLDAHEKGSFTEEDAGRYVKEALLYQSTLEIANFGERVLTRIRTFIAESPSEILQGQINTYMGQMPLQQLMDLGLGHSVHHLKQLYFYMKQVGFVPENPLSQKDLDGVAVPTELF